MSENFEAVLEEPFKRPSCIVRRPDQLEARLALTEADKQHAYKLRHEGYVAAGYMNPRADNRLQDAYDNLDSSKSILLFREGQAVASVRVCLLDLASKTPGASSIPASELFDLEIKRLLIRLKREGRPARAVEITKLTSHRESVKDTDLVFAIFRMTGYLILHFDVDVVFSLVRTSHIRFYKRLGFQEISDPRPYPKLNVVVSLLVCFRTSFSSVQSGIPILAGLSSDDSIYADFLSGELIPVFPKTEGIL